MKKILIKYGAVILYCSVSLYITILYMIKGSLGQALMGPVSLLFLLVCPAAEKILRVKFDMSIRNFITLFCIFAFQLGTGLEWYVKFENYSFLVHAVSGTLFTQIGFCLYYIVRKRNVPDLKHDWLLTLTYAFFFSMAVAVVWEIGEYFTYLTTGRDVQHTLDTGVHDTMLDLISCFAGSLFMGYSYMRYVFKDKKNYFVRVIDRFYQLNASSEKL